MNIIVCVKETYDIDHIKIDSATLDPLLQGIPVELEDLSKNALETAVKLKEKHGGKVTALTLAEPKTIKKTIKEALAMGADEAVIIVHSVQGMNPAATALALAHGIKQIKAFDMIVLGEGSADNYSGQVGPRMAQVLKLPLASYVCGVEVKDKKLHCTTDLEDGYEILEASLPSIIAVTNEINEPRLPSLSDILKASKKPIKEIKLESLSIQKEHWQAALESTKMIRNKAPKIERKRQKLQGELDDVIAGLISSLSKEGFVA